MSFSFLLYPALDLHMLLPIYNLFFCSYFFTPLFFLIFFQIFLFFSTFTCIMSHISYCAFFPALRVFPLCMVFFLIKIHTVSFPIGYMIKPNSSYTKGVSGVCFVLLKNIKERLRFVNLFARSQS